MSSSYNNFLKLVFLSDADIDFLSHYRLVEQSRIDSYARAFVVEDSDLDTVINNSVRLYSLVMLRRNF